MFQLLSFPVLVTWLSLLLVALLGYLKKLQNNEKLPPGPPKLPFIGNLHNLASSNSPFPHITLKNLSKKYGPLMHLKLGETSAVIVSSADVAEQVLKTNETCFAQRPSFFAANVAGYGDLGLFFAPYNTFMKQIKKVYTLELLGAKQVKSFNSIRREEVETLMESISLSQGDKPIDLSQLLLQSMINIVSRAAFGEVCEDSDEFFAALMEGHKYSSGFELPDLFPSLASLFPYVSSKTAILQGLRKRMDNVLDKIINDHRAKRSSAKASALPPARDDDFVDVLLRLQEESTDYTITNDNLKALIMETFTAGTESTAITMEWAMSEMLKNPGTMKKAQAEVREAFKGKNNISEEDIQELRYLKLIIKETLRLHSPGALLARESKERCEVNGYTIHANTKAILNVWAIGRDPNIFEKPDSFWPERFIDSPINFVGTGFELLAFGSGRRMCPGISFAMASIELHLAMLLYHFDFKLPNGIKAEELDMTEAIGFLAKREHALHVTATRYRTL